MSSNAFVGRTEAPTCAELVNVLGGSWAAWEGLIHWAASELHVEQQEWKGVCSQKYGWSLRLQQKKRNILYLSPCQGCFCVSFVLGECAMQKVRAASFPARVAKIIEEAPKYPEGTGIRLMVKTSRDLPPIRTLSKIKLEN